MRLQIDPKFALAYAELAQSYTWKIFLFATRDRQWQEKAFIAADKALSLDPNLAMAYLARGRLLWTPVNRFPHARDYRKAVALDPRSDEARNQLALIYCLIGYFEEAFRESQAAALTKPDNHLSIDGQHRLWLSKESMQARTCFERFRRRSIQH